MSLFSQIINGTITNLSAKDLWGVKNISLLVFYNSRLQTIEFPITCIRIGDISFLDSTFLTTVKLPSNLKYIGIEAFSGCTALNNIELNMDPYCVIRKNAFLNTPFYTNATKDIISINGKVLIKAVTSTSFPSSIINIASNSCNKLVTNSTLIIPDQIEIIGGPPASSIATLSIGNKVSELYTESIPTTVTTLICRQPADFIVTLPEPGDGSGLTYNKDSRNMTLYTDNESLKNYNWDGDNVTVTIYPLSQAPV